MLGRRQIFLVVAVVLSACSGELDSETAAAPTDSREGASSPSPSPRPAPFQPDFDQHVDAGADATPNAKPAPVDPLFDLRLKEQIRGVVRDDYASYDWDSLLHQNEPFSGVKIWIPGTGGRLADDLESGRAMVTVPDGLAVHGPAVMLSSGAPAASSTSVWFGAPCSQSVGGALFAERGKLSALEVFNTAWSDAKAIAAFLGPRLKGAWVVAHSAGTNPAMLMALIGGAHRVDIYGVPSAVGALDGDDGIVHAHTHPLDPAGSMGKLVDNGRAELNLLGAAVTAIKAGVTMQYHHYGAWPAPSP